VGCHVTMRMQGQGGGYAAAAAASPSTPPPHAAAACGVLQRVGCSKLRLVCRLLLKLPSCAGAPGSCGGGGMTRAKEGGGGGNGCRVWG